MSELQQCQNRNCVVYTGGGSPYCRPECEIEALDATVAELQAERSMLEGSVAHWKGQFNIAGEMVQDKKRLITDQAKEIERLRKLTETATNNAPLRMYIALKMMRAWNNVTVGFSADVVVTVNDWIDGGMEGPIPFPSSPFFAEWATDNGLSNIDGRVGFLIKARMQ